MENHQIEKNFNCKPCTFTPRGVAELQSYADDRGTWLWCQRIESQENSYLACHDFSYPACFQVRNCRRHYDLQPTADHETIVLPPVSGHGHRRNGTFKSAYCWSSIHGRRQNKSCRNVEQYLAWLSDDQCKVSRRFSMSEENLGKICAFVLSKDEDTLKAVEARLIWSKDPLMSIKINMRLPIAQLEQPDGVAP